MAFQPTEIAARMLSSRALMSTVPLDPNIGLTVAQKHIIQVLCCTMAWISLASCLCAVYWFKQMRENYRRRLIFFLLLGDAGKSLTYIINSTYTFANGAMPMSRDVFCQISGWFLSFGLEQCDIAILFISMHMALQIFPPRWSRLGNDGLYNVRGWVRELYYFVPILLAALAFVNPNGGYTVAGAWCWLPVRRFWYRLALSYIPRYLIWAYIMGVAIRIYWHVGYEFRVFGEERDRSSSVDVTAVGSFNRKAMANVASQHGQEGIAPDDASTKGLRSTNATPPESVKALPNNTAVGGPVWGGPFSAAAIDTSTSASMPTSRRGSRQVAPGIFAEDFSAPHPTFSAKQRGSVSTIASGHPSIAQSVDGLASIVEGKRDSGLQTDDGPTNLADRAMRQRRSAIQRQLRMLFIYPVIYMLMWIIPMVAHFLSYSDHFAKHPVFGLSMMSSFCQTLMGFVDVCVFCWRERPWHHIPGSDGTFLGSFCFWKFDHDGKSLGWLRRNKHEDLEGQDMQASEKRPSDSSDQPAPLPATKYKWLKPWTWASNKQTASPTDSARPSVGHKRTFSGGSDRKTKESEQAHERLALERADYEKQRPSLTERRVSVISQLKTQGTAPALQPTPVAEGTDPFDGEVEKHQETIEPAKWNGHVR
ncbi:G protein-coupled receptor gpr1 [Oleoguttula sp. CCFEE 5521]